MKKKTLEKHTTYFEVVETMTKSSNCPFCSLESKVSYKYLDSLLYEKVNDGGIRKEIRGANGFCKKHGEELLELGGSLGIGIIYDELLKRILALFDAISTGYPHRIYQNRLEELKEWVNHKNCPACIFTEKALDRYMDTFIYFLSDDEMKDAFENSAGLCIPHFLRIFLKIDSEEDKAYLLKIEKEKMVNLEKNLSEFVRKQDYRFEHEPLLKEEAVSWIKAVAMLTGGKGSK